MKKALKKILICILVISLIFAYNIMASNVIIQGGSEDQLYSSMGPGFGSEVVLTGDSYAKRFYEDEKNRDIKFYGYFNEGYTLDMNKITLREAFNSYCKIIFLSISVNDRHKSTHPEEFESELRELFDIAARKNKIVLVHSYMLYGLASTMNFPYLTYEYDSMIRKLIMEYNNVYYIDMSDCTGSEYMMPDGIHFNKKFNDEMYNRIVFMINHVRENFYE